MHGLSTHILLTHLMHLRRVVSQALARAHWDLLTASQWRWSQGALSHTKSPSKWTSRVTTACRGVQAAAIRASKTALEFHNVRILGTGSRLLLFGHGIGYNMTVSRHANGMKMK